MIPERITGHEDEAAALLTEHYRGKQVTEGLVRVFAGRAQALENTVWQVLDAYLLDSATGVQLEALGAIVGEDRLARSDARYRKAIKVRIRVNRSKGRAVDIIDVARLLDSSAEYREFSYLAWEVSIFGTPYGGDFSKLLAQTKAASSYGVLLTSTWSSSGVSRFSDSSDPTPDQVFESAI